MPNPLEATIAHHWTTYRQAAVPQTASQVQITATERAFYAGAMIVLEVILALGEVDDDRAEELLAGLKEESDAYLEAVRVRIPQRWH